MHTEMYFDPEEGFFVDYGYAWWPSWSYMLVPGTYEEDAHS